MLFYLLLGRMRATEKSGKEASSKNNDTPHFDSDSVISEKPLKID